jgi:hypothetical protein
METTETKPTRGVITGNEGGPIELEKAAKWTANHRHRHSKGGTISQFFGQVILNRILQQDDCLGIRIYYANSHSLSGWQRFWVGIGNFFIKTIANAEGEQRFVITGVTETGEDLLPGETKGETAVTSPVHTYKIRKPVDIGDQSMPCPGSVGCPSNSLSS